MTPTVLAYTTPWGLTFRCAYCRVWHRHGHGGGHRQAHCYVRTSPYLATGYDLVVGGPLTADIRRAASRLEPAPRRSRGRPMNAATVTIDAARVSPSRALARLARASAQSGGPLVVVTGRAFGGLADELGGYDAAARHLFPIATNVGKPVAVNVPTGPDTSTTVFISPKGWTDERLRGWAAGRHQELEAAFGTATVMREEDL